MPAKRRGRLVLVLPIGAVRLLSRSVQSRPAARRARIPRAGRGVVLEGGGGWRRADAPDHRRGTRADGASRATPSPRAGARAPERLCHAHERQSRVTEIPFGADCDTGRECQSLRCESETCRTFAAFLPCKVWAQPSFRYRLSVA